MTEIVDEPAVTGSLSSRVWTATWAAAQAASGLLALLVCLAVFMEEPTTVQTRPTAASPAPATESFGRLPHDRDDSPALSGLASAQTRSSWTVFYLVDSPAQRDQVEQFESELGVEALTGGYSQTERYYRLFFITNEEDEDAAIRAIFKHTLTMSATQRIEVFDLRVLGNPN